MTFQGLEVERDNGVVTLWLANPTKLNALTNIMVIGIGQLLAELDQDDNCRVVVLRGRNKVFCVGRELNDFLALQGAEPEDVLEMYGHMRRLHDALYTFSKPTVCAVERYCFGAGAMVASWCDFVIAAADAKFGYPEVGKGMTPYIAIPRLVHAFGRKAAMDLLLTGRHVTAAEAEAMGLAGEVVPPQDLDAAVQSTCSSLLAASGPAIAKTKDFIRRCETMTYPASLALAVDLQALSVGYPETKAGVAAFLASKEKT